MTDRQEDELDIREEQLVEILCDVSQEGRIIDAGAIQLNYLSFTDMGNWAIHGPGGEEYITVLNPHAFRDTAELRTYLNNLVTTRLGPGQQQTDIHPPELIN